MPSPRLLTSWPTLGNNLKFTVTTLILSNLVPLFGVIFLGWSVFSIMVLFWFENVIIGFYNVLKMVFASGTHPLSTAHSAARQFSNPAAMQLSKLFFIPFFIIHYGIFTTVHGAFVFMMFGAGGLAGRAVSISGGSIRTMVSEVVQSLFVPALFLFVSHGISFVLNYLKNGEYKKETAHSLMGQVYGRVVLLHIAILAGGFTAVFFGSNILVLIILIGLKIWMDVNAHLRQHMESADPATAPTPAY